MTTQIRMRSLAAGAFALAVICAPAVGAMAQPYSDDYDAQQAARIQYDHDRANYDAQYGPGAYDRYYSAQSGETERVEADRACHDEKKGNATAGAVLGGIAGAVIGSNVARGGGREGGAIIGGVGGAVVGSNIAKNTTNCDQ